MMRYPLTIEQFRYLELEKGINMEFITVFINAINNVYERGTKAVTVAAVEEYAVNEPEQFRMVIRVKRKSHDATA